MKRVLFILLLLASAIHFSFAQKANTPSSEQDSAVNELKAMLLENEQMHYRDSIRAVIWAEEMSKITNRNKQNELKEEIAKTKQDDSLLIFQQKQTIAALKEKTRGAQVMLLYDTLFTIWAPLGSFTAEQRAKSAAERIRKLYEQSIFTPDSVQVVAQYGMHNVCYGNQIITSISSMDALWLNTSADSLASNYAQIVKIKVAHFKKAYSFNNVLLRIGYAACVIVVLVVVLWLLRTVFYRLFKTIAATKKNFKRKIELRNYELLSPTQILGILRQLLIVLRLICYLIACYFAITIIFSIFPGTQKWAQTLIGWIWQPFKGIIHSVIAYIPDLITVVVILVVMRYVVRLLRFFSIEIERGILKIKGFHKEWARPTFSIIRFLLYAFTFIIAFPYLPGSDSEAFKGVSVFLGILFSIGSSSAISNTVAGLVITYMRPFKIGDWIKVNDNIGYVVEKTALVTRIRTFYNEDVTIPNATVLANHTINYSTECKKEGLILSVGVTPGYDATTEDVEALLFKAAALTEHVEAEPKPFVLLQKFNDFNVVYELNVTTRNPEKMFHIKSDLNKHISAVFKEAGVAIITMQQVQIGEQNKPI